MTNTFNLFINVEIFYSYYKNNSCKDAIFKPTEILN